MADLGEMYLETQRPPELPHDRVFGALNRGHEALIEWLRQLTGGGPPMVPPVGYGDMAANAALDQRNPTRAYRQRNMLNIVRDDPLTMGAWRDLQGGRHSVPRSIIDYFSSAFDNAPPEMPPLRGEPYEARQSPWLGDIKQPAIRPDLPPHMAVDDYERRRRK